MSRWLSQVNNLLEKLDGQVETVAEDGVPNVVHTVSTRAKQFLTSNQTESDESYQHVSDEMEEVYSGDSYDDEDEEGEEDEDEDEIDEEEQEEEEDGDSKGEEEDEEEVGDIMPSQSIIRPAPPRASSNRTHSGDNLPSMSTMTNEGMPEEEIESSNDMNDTSEEQESLEEAVDSNHPPPSVVSASVSNQELKQINMKWSQKVDSLKSQHLAEIRTLHQKQSKLESQLGATQKELSAVGHELDQAAEIVKKERKSAAEERDELLVEQEEDLQALKEEYEEKVQDLHDQLAEQAADYESKLISQEEDFQHEGGNLTSDLTKLRDREKAAQEEIKNLHTQVSELVSGHESLVEMLNAEKSRAQTAEDRATASEKASAFVEERLDSMQSSHQKQLQQKQFREAELEQMVAELSQKIASNAAPSVVEKVSIDQEDYKEKYEVSCEELHLVRSEVEVFKERCSKLQNELTSLSKEHALQYQSTQEQIRGYEHQVQDLRKRHTVPQHDNNMTERVQQLSMELEQAKTEVGDLSDQLVRQKGTTETTKSEVLALKGRLQIATTRAEKAEQAQHSSSAADLEVGPAARRRRVKGGRTRFGQLPTRTIRNSVGLRAGSSRLKQQLGESLDALDTWILETGHIMRHEPLARFGLAMYMVILHLWCFGLIAYHTFRSEHTDFSQLGDRSRIPHIHHNPTSMTGPP